VCSSEWALLLPAWSIVLIITTYIVYSALAIAATPSFSEMRAITGQLPQYLLSARMTNMLDVDNRAHFPLDGEDNPYFNSTQTPELYDIPIGMVNRVLYHQSVNDE
jgi:phosphatidylinositol glycan class P protein